MKICLIITLLLTSILFTQTSYGQLIEKDESPSQECKVMHAGVIDGFFSGMFSAAGYAITHAGDPFPERVKLKTKLGENIQDGIDKSAMFTGTMGGLYLALNGFFSSDFFDLPDFYKDWYEKKKNILSHIDLYKTYPNRTKYLNEISSRISKLEKEQQALVLDLSNSKNSQGVVNKNLELINNRLNKMRLFRNKIARAPWTLTLKEIEQAKGLEPKVKVQIQELIKEENIIENSIPSKKAKIINAQNKVMKIGACAFIYTLGSALYSDNIAAYIEDFVEDSERDSKLDYINNLNNTKSKNVTNK